MMLPLQRGAGGFVSGWAKPDHVTQNQRRPATEIIDIHKDFRAFSGPNVPNIWPNADLPRLVARLIAAIGTACDLFYLYSELARIAS